MKKLLLFSGLFLFAASMVFSQILDNPQILQELDLNEEQIERITQLQKEEERIRREAHVEIRLIKAKMDKLLLRKNVDMDEVDELLRASLEWRFRIERVQIRNRIEIRRILGDEKYEKLLRLMNRYRNQKKSQPGKKDDRKESNSPSESNKNQNQSRSGSPFNE